VYLAPDRRWTSPGRSKKRAGSFRGARTCSPEAKRETERIAEEARERQAELVSRHELVRQSERAAEEIIEGARGRDREIRLGAEDYADEILNTLELNLAKLVAAIQRGRERLRGSDEHAEAG
jgi:hypothetical protein